MLAFLAAAAIFVAQTPSPDDRTVIDKRLVHRVDFAAKISIEEGDTIIIDRTEKIPAKRISKKLTEYESTASAAGAPKGIAFHARPDEIKVEPDGDKASLTFRYVVHADPGVSTGGGRVQITLKLVERTGLANQVAESKISQWINIVPAKFELKDLETDFYGYRVYDRLAREKMDILTKKAGLKGLTMADQAKLPSLDRVGPDTAATAFEFERLRTRTWIAHRHLVAARGSKDEKIATAAKAYLANLDKPDGELTGLPTGTAAPKVEEKPKEVETLKPEHVEEAPAAGKGGAKTAAGGGAIAPVASYDPTNESEEDEPTEPSKPKDDKPKGKQKALKPGDKGKKVAQADTSADPKIKVANTTLGGTEILAERELSREIPIPLYPRGLLLDDPNIAYAVGSRLEWAKVKGIHGQSGKAPAIFYDAEVAVTRALGVELSVPSAYVSVDIQRAQATYVMGNPLLSAKYRFHLPEVLGRMPVLTVRGRWAIPIQPLHAVPPTQLGAEEFSQPAHFDDLSAFLLEKSAFGLGVNAAWMTNIVYVGFQLYSDYFVPVSGANDQTSFLTFSYGASVGALPFGDIVGFFFEVRAATLLAGPRRTEFFTYLGARAHLVDFVEPAVWIALPLGSVRDVTGLQLGVGLRFTYDIQDAIVLAKQAPDRGLLQ